MTSTPPRPDESGQPDAGGAAPAGPAAGGDLVNGAPAGPAAVTDLVGVKPAGPGAGADLVGAERGGIDAHEVDSAARLYWEAEADTYQAEHGAFLAGAELVVDSDHLLGGIDYRVGAGVGDGAFVWGPEGRTEAELGLLGPVEALRGRRVLEVGCGGAQCSAWLAQRGVHAVGVDIAVAQLRHAPVLARHSPLCQPSGDPTAAGMTQDGDAAPGAVEVRGSLAVAAASATALPFVDRAFDVAFASYGAVQFVADLPRLLGEVRRVLRPGGAWVCSVTHPIRWAFPDDPGPAGLTATMSYFDRLPYVERVPSGQAVYAEFHRTIGDYVAALRAAGFTIEAMVEPEWPDWNDQTWGGWSPLRGTLLPGTLILRCLAT